MCVCVWYKYFFLSGQNGFILEVLSHRTSFDVQREKRILKNEGHRKNRETKNKNKNTIKAGQDTLEEGV